MSPNIPFKNQKILWCKIRGLIPNIFLYVRQGSCLKLITCFVLVSAGSELQ